MTTRASFLGLLVLAAASCSSVASSVQRVTVASSSLLRTTWTHPILGHGVHDCTTGGRPLQCSFALVHPGASEYRDADALVFFMGEESSALQRARPDQLLVGFMMESAANVRDMDDKVHVANFDIEMSYRSCSQVQASYLEMLFITYNFLQGRRILSTPDAFPSPVPYADKLTAVAYINSNCHTLSHREEIMREFMRINAVPVHSFGLCDHNMGLPGGRLNEPWHTDFMERKIQLLGKYKFCIAMENSVANDYVTEKVWDALFAGCLPVYLGAPNINEYLPADNAVIHYAELGSVQKLVQVLEHLSRNEAAYAERMAWRSKPLEQLNPRFQAHILRYNQHLDWVYRCELCQVIAQHKEVPQQHVLCPWNTTWAASST